MYPYNNQTPTSRRVVVYARVSTEHEAQLSALENQKDWYRPIVSQHPEWEIIRMYVDEERSYPELFKGIETERKLGSMPYRYHKYDLDLG